MQLTTAHQKKWLEDALAMTWTDSRRVLKKIIVVKSAKMDSGVVPALSIFQTASCCGLLECAYGGAFAQSFQ